MRFDVHVSDPTSWARLGRLTTAHGSVDTPGFTVVGTQATVKGLRPEDVVAAGAQAVLCNTYHLYLRPGPELVAAQGGLHLFMGWVGPMFIYCGVYQVFSLGVCILLGMGKYVV